MAEPKLQIDTERVVRELGELAEFSDAPSPAVTRVLFTPQDLAAREWLRKRFRAEELDVREDRTGNIFARWQGTQPDLPAVGTGSHTDAIPHSGRYDGTVGVLGALEAIRTLKESGFRPQRSIELLMFTSEEPTRFGVGRVGSRLLSGATTSEAAQALKDEGGESFEQVRQQAGCQGGLADVGLPADYYSAFVELHIEQGPLLEKQKKDIGIVTAIAAPSPLRIIYEGTGGHAGATLMAGRADALVAGAELVLAVEHSALSIGGADTVATTGILDVHPRAINSIPSQIRLEIDGDRFPFVGTMIAS
jgi:N-carbamoyl-L-amino-acid hydrolase